MQRLVACGDIMGAEKKPERRSSQMTRQERDMVVDRMLTQYVGIGTTIVADDQSLCRLLSTLELTRTDRALGDYLCSFLTS
jgi:hypothetical protein